MEKMTEIREEFVPGAQDVAEGQARKSAFGNQENEPVSKALLRIVLSLLVIAVGIMVILFLVSKAAQYESVGSMLQHMGGELNLMWQRIIA